CDTRPEVARRRCAGIPRQKRPEERRAILADHSDCQRDGSSQSFREFTKIIGERICDLLRTASWNRPAYSVPGKPEHKCEGRGNRRFQRKKRVSSNPREKSPGWFVLK